jgi:hypothetical protein
MQGFSDGKLWEKSRNQEKKETVLARDITKDETKNSSRL